MNRYLEYFIHGILIVLVLILINLPRFDIMIGVFQSKDLSLLLPSLIGTLINSTIFYSILFYFIPVTLRERGTRAFISMLLIFIVVLSLIELLFDFYFASKKNISTTEFINDQVLFVLIVHILTTISAIAYSFIKDWFKNEQFKKKLGEQKTAMELALLKSQVNPHFLFNALNSLFSMALKNKDRKTAEGISKLAEMMRYTLDISKNENVTLEDEVAYLKDYIYMQKLRFEDGVIVNFNSESIKNLNKNLPGMLFMPFVENAFKYGVSVNEQAVINIDLTSRDDCLVFEIENKIYNMQFPELSNNIGISNVKKQLKLLFPNKHQLQIEKVEDLFKVKLVLETK